MICAYTYIINYNYIPITYVYTLNTVHAYTNTHGVSRCYVDMSYGIPKTSVIWINHPNDARTTPCPTTKCAMTSTKSRNMMIIDDH